MVLTFSQDVAVSPDHYFEYHIQVQHKVSTSSSSSSPPSSVSLTRM